MQSLKDQHLQEAILSSQQKHNMWIQQERQCFPFTKNDEGIYCWSGIWVIPPDDDLKRQILYLTHDALMAGHPGQDATKTNTEQWCWWPGLTKWINEYCTGCTMCQATKVITHP